MKIEFAEKELPAKVVEINGKAYRSPQKSSWERVMVDGVQWGLVPLDKEDPHYRVFHPTLSNLSPGLCNQVVAQSGGRLLRTLAAPVHVEPQEVDDEPLG